MNANNTVAETLDIFLQTPRLNAWIFERVRPWCGRRVLEVGSGVGNLTGFLLRELVIATDIEHEFVDRLRARFRDHPNVIVSRLGLGNFDVESIRGYAPDTVLCVNVLEHVEDDRRALRLLADAIPAGGHLLLYVPALPWLYGSLDRGLRHHRRYGWRELRERMECAGWRVIHQSYMNILGIPGWFLTSRLLRRDLLPIRQVKLYDRLTPILRLEDRVRLPIGMSLVAIGQRRGDLA